MSDDRCIRLQTLFEADMGVTDPDPEFEIRGVLADGTIDHGMVQCQNEATFLFREHGGCALMTEGYCADHIPRSIRVFCSKCFDAGDFHYIDTEENA